MRSSTVSRPRPGAGSRHSGVMCRKGSEGSPAVRSGSPPARTALPPRSTGQEISHHGAERKSQGGGDSPRARQYTHFWLCSRAVDSVRTSSGSMLVRFRTVATGAQRAPPRPPGERYPPPDPADGVSAAEEDGGEDHAGLGALQPAPHPTPPGGLRTTRGPVGVEKRSPRPPSSYARFRSPAQAPAHFSRPGAVHPG